MKTRVAQRTIVETVMDGLLTSQLDDLPRIRQALNDVADGYRKDGYDVPDYDQDKMVNDVRRFMGWEGTRVKTERYW